MKIISNVLFILAISIAGLNRGFSESLENLLGISTDLDKGEITIQAASSGCTVKKDFRFVYQKDILAVYRTKRDSCKAMPEKISLTYKMKDVGVVPNKAFSLSNRIIVNYNLAGK
jgi:hypothetical protein